MISKYCELMKLILPFRFFETHCIYMMSIIGWHESTLP